MGKVGRAAAKTGAAIVMVFAGIGYVVVGVFEVLGEIK